MQINNVAELNIENRLHSTVFKLFQYRIELLQINSEIVYCNNMNKNSIIVD